MNSSAVATATGTLALGVLFMGSTIPAPLYPNYQKAFSFSGLTLTLVYAVYVLGNLGVLIVFGGLADRIGRRTTILFEIGLAAASTAAFAAASHVAWLFVARFLSGLATGLVAGAATAWITDAERDAQAASRIATASNFAGLAFSAILAGALAQLAPAPLLLSYLVYLAILLGLVKVHDRSHRRSNTLKLWRLQRVRVPTGDRSRLRRRQRSPSLRSSASTRR